MQPPESAADSSPSPTRRQLQGPRPPQLRVSKDSHAIKKPPPVPHPRGPPPHTAVAATTQNRQPIIIYSVSPKVIHTTVSDFMSVVQRLTGSSSATSGEAVSPAARLASIERTSPKNGDKKDKETVKDDDLMDMVEAFDLSQISGILSPSPATLQPISPGMFFSPRSDPPISLYNDLSPFLYGNMFMPSPTTLFSAPIVSPSPSSSFDLMNRFLDF